MKSPIKFAFVIYCAAILSLLSSRADTIQVQVGAGGLKFTPQNAAVHVGDTVEWVWEGNDHSTTSGTPGNPDGLWDSGVQSEGFTFDHTFPGEGTFNYYCTVHGSCCGMVGTVTVSAAGDTVHIMHAIYTTSNSDLTVQATDSDTSATLTVSVTKSGVILGTMTHKSGNKFTAKFKGIKNPKNITVTSSLGGSDSARVKTK